jgi:hypothetical protein
MDRDRVLRLLEAVRDGEVAPAAAANELRDLDVAHLSGAGGPDGDGVFARIDHHRALRCGVPEVIYGPGKTPDQLVAVAVQILSRGSRLLATRVSPEQWTAVEAAIPDARFHERARAVTVERAPPAPGGRVAIISAGTADEPVAEEARVTAAALGARVTTFYDCGVAGLHRLLHVLPELRQAEVVVVVAGMEGALASVVGGLVDVPVVAVPTSVGYGAGFEGIGPLLTMLNSCAAGVAVVNIDNGFGAGYLAARIARPRDLAHGAAATEPRSDTPGSQRQRTTGEAP